MKQLLLSFLLTSLSTSILVLLLSLLFAALKTKISVRVKYFIWFLVLLSFLVPFRPQLGSGLIRLNAGSTVQTAVTAVGTDGAQGSSQVAEKAAQSNLWEAFLRLPWFEILFVVWLVGFAFSLGRYVYSYIRFRKMLQRWGTEVRDEGTLAQLPIVQQEMGINSKIRLLHYPMTQSPMLLGFRDILIVLPELDYTEEELQLIFKHELTHYKHRDILVNLLGILARSLHWFNPVVRFACREMQEVGEMYCDYDVLSSRDTEYRTFYGETILTMIDRSQKSPIALTTCFYSDKFNLKRRIIGIMDSRLPKKFLSTAFIVAAPFLLLLSSSVFAFESPDVQVQKSKPVTSQKQSQGLSQSQALTAALKELSLAEKDVKDLQVVREKDTYKIRFSHEQTVHEIIVNAKDGKLLQSKQHTTIEKTVTVEKEVSPSSSATGANPANNETPVTGQTGTASSYSTGTGAGATTVQPPAQNTVSQDDPDTDDDQDDDDDDDD